MIKYKSKFHESQLKVIVDYKVAKYIVKLLDQVLSWNTCNKEENQYNNFYFVVATAFTYYITTCTES